MSQNDYKIKLVVDDSAIKQLSSTMNGIFTNKIGSKSGGNSTSNPIQSLLKLGAIATGIGTLVIGVKKLVDITVGSSPMLQSMLQLFNNSLMFIFRPIGDFIGFLLKPIMLMFLRFAIPFYKTMDPFMQKYGTLIGNWISGLSTTPSPSTLTGTMKLGTTPKNAIQNLKDNLTFGGLFDPTSPNYIFKMINTSALNSSWQTLVSFFKPILADITTTLKPAWNALIPVFDYINLSLNNTLIPAWDSLFNFFKPIISAISTPTKAWLSIVGFFNFVNSKVSGMFSSFNSLVNFFKPIASAVNGVVSKGVTAFIKLFVSAGSMITSAVSTSVTDFIGFFTNLGTAINGAVGTAWTDFMNFWAAIQTFIQNIINWLKNPWGNPNNPNNGNSTNNITINVASISSPEAAALLKNPNAYINKVNQSNLLKTPR